VTLNEPLRMPHKPFFSIVTASLNNGNAIVNNLESVRNQSCQDLEHIVIDGGSADCTLSILERYRSLYAVRWISETDNGIADALNKGIRLANGLYCIVVQADDYLIDPTALDYVARLIRNQNYDICSFPVIQERPGSTPFLHRPIKVPGWYHFKFTIPHQGAFVHKRLFEKIGGFREEFSIAMDYDFFYRAFAAKASIRFFSRPVSYMGGWGISSGNQILRKRLEEEKQVQDLNEKSKFWRAAQKVFRFLYIPYKTRCIWRHKPPCVRSEPPSPSPHARHSIHN
jgi:glycosyltransferase involved in cell wall biosynthesis